MLLIECWNQLTPDQRDALLQEMRRQRAESERDLAEARKAVEAVQLHGEEERQKLRAELNRRGDRIAELSTKEIHTYSALRSTTGALSETLTALRRLMAAHRQLRNSGYAPEAQAVLDKVWSEAEEVLRKFDIPFGFEPIEPAAG